jgi:hypothetical protein
MIGVKLMGGLGNQMFQYSLGRSLSLKNSTKLGLDLSFYNNQAETDTQRHFELNYFNIKGLLILKPMLDNKPLIPLFSKSIYFPHHYLENKFSFSNEVFSQPDGTLFQGYWQTEKYFLDIGTQLMEDFSLKNSLSADDKRIEDEINRQVSVSLHVRRGDYVNNESANKFHGLMDIDYYKAALDIMNTKIEAYKLFIFSDDIEWCKNNLNNLHSNIYFIDGKRDGAIDMHLMKTCKHNIIANSSFSWWGAWLNGNDNKVVIAPKLWFNDKKADTTDLIPKKWLQI